MDNNIKKYQLDKKELIVEQKLPFKLIIPSYVQKKIDLMCLKVNNIEWSGSLFYEYEGSWKDNNLVIRVLDFFLQDIGGVAFTEFEQDANLVRYRLDNNLLSAYMGLIHSHHNMQAFFSGTDINTLKKEAQDHNHFLSLVVNNKRQYVAAITAVNNIIRNNKIEEEVTFTTFNGEQSKSAPSTFYTTEEIKEVVYTMLDITIEDYEDSNIELLERIEEIQKSKTKSTSWTKDLVDNWSREGQFYNRNQGLPYQTNISGSYQLDMFENNTNYFNPSIKEEIIQEKITKEEENFDIPEVEIDPKIIEYKAKQLVTLSKILPKENKVNINSFIKSMPSLYGNAFKDKADYRNFIGFFIESIIMDETLYKETDNSLIEDDSYISYYLSTEIINLLTKEANGITNEYFKELIDELTAYTF